MINTFIYNNVTVTVDTEAYTISFLDPNYASQSNIIRVWKCDWVETELSSNSIKVKPYTYVTDINGKTVVGTEEQFPKLRPRYFNNDTVTITGAGQFDFFAGLTNQSIAIKEIFSRALINNQLENLIDVFGKPLSVWNPYSDWEFIIPIEATVSAERVLLVSTITVAMITSSSFEYRLLQGESLISDWQSSNIFTGDYVGDYIVHIRSTVDTNQELLTINVQEPIIL